MSSLLNLSNISQNKEKVVCHFCGYENKIINTCKKTQNKCNFSMFGPGVERIFEELKIKLPERKIKIFQVTICLKRKSLKKFLKKLKKGYRYFSRYTNDF